MRSPAARADTRLTYDDFVLFPDDGKRHESIDGEHVVTPAPNVRHQVLVRRLVYDLERYFRAHPQLDAVQVFRPTPEGRLARVVELTVEDGDVLTTPLLPGCQSDLRELFRTHL